MYLILLNILLKIVVVVVIDFPHTNLNLFANVYPLLQYYTTTINLPVMCTFQVSPWSEEFRAIQLRRLTYQRFQSCKFENSGDLIILGQSRYPFKPPNENKWFREIRWFYINNNKPKLFCLMFDDGHLFILFVSSLL